MNDKYKNGISSLHWIWILKILSEFQVLSKNSSFTNG